MTSLPSFFVPTRSVTTSQGRTRVKPASLLQPPDSLPVLLHHLRRLYAYIFTDPFTNDSK